MKNLNKADKNLIKKINTVAILKEINKNGPISRAEIAKNITLNPATVSSNVMDLLGSKIVRETGSGKSSGGRKPILLEMNTEDNYVIGVHIDIDKVKITLFNINCQKIADSMFNLDTRNDFQYVADKCIGSIHKLIKENVSGDKKVLGIGMAVHGLVDSEKGVSIFAPAFNWKDVSLSEHIQNELHIPVVVENDTRAMALAANWFGGAKGSSNFILLNIGSGIGAGMYLNGELYSGNNFGAGEIGHVAMTNENIRCNCGKHGCFESVASSSGIVFRYLKALEEKKLEENLEVPENVTLDYIYASARRGDFLSKKILNDTGMYIGKGISMLVNVLNPDKIILAGEVAKAKLFILPEIERTVAAKSMNNNLKDLYIGETTLKDDIGVMGAATLIIKKLFSV